MVATMNKPPRAPRLIMITGGSDGIGAAAARALARRGDRIVIVGRSPDKTRAIAAELGADSHVADFADLGQVRELAAEASRRYPRIDVLVNNAGLIAGPERTVTTDGHELTFQVNHLAPFLLTALLREQLSAAGGRVITRNPGAVSSSASVMLVSALVTLARPTAEPDSQVTVCAEPLISTSSPTRRDGGLDTVTRRRPFPR